MKNKLKLILVIIVTILTFISIISGINYKVAKTGLKLMAINFDISLIQEDEENNSRLDASEAFEKDMAERSAIYNSEDTIIRWYANLSKAVKLLLLIVDLAYTGWISLSVFMFIVDAMTEKQKKRKKSNCNISNEYAK